VFLHAHDTEHSIVDVTKTTAQRLEKQGKICNLAMSHHEHKLREDREWVARYYPDAFAACAW
jgi:hypothetical protein